MSFESGAVLRSRAKPKNWSGLRIQYSNTTSPTLSRSKNVSYKELGRTISYISSDDLGLSMISVGYLYCRSFKENSRSCFFINPNIVFGTMKEKFIRDVVAESEVKSTGYDLASGVMWYPIREIGIKASLGYRILKMKIDIFEATGEIVNWTGPYLGAGICIALP